MISIDTCDESAICSVVKYLLSNIFIPGVVSYIAARLFWINSFKSRSSKIQFASFIGRKDDGSIYVQYMNTGKKDLIEVKYIIRLRYKKRKKMVETVEIIVPT